MRQKILWVAAALALIAIPAVIGLVALRGDDSTSSSRRAAALIAAGAGAHELQMDGLLPAADDRVIDVESWSWGVSQSATAYSATTGGAGTGKAQFNEFNFSKKVDVASPKLFLNCSKGTIFPKVILTSRKAGAKQEYMVITLEQVIISSVQLSGSGAEVPMESVSLNFAKATISATQIGEAGELEGAPVIHSYDLRTVKTG